MEQQHGLLAVNKPRGLSSAKCTNAIKRLGQTKIGHAGTLDPMAQGLLLVLLGHATKISGYLMSGGQKVYRGTLRLGQDTDTWDAEGTVVSEAPWDSVTPASVRQVIADWQGTHEQEVPPYSAAKHQGQPLYKLSRAGKTTPVKTKPVTIDHSEVIGVDLPYVSFRVTCSSGTYIRSLAHSLGMRLGCGAVLTELIREYSHPFSLDDAWPLDTLLAEPERLAERVVPIDAALPHWPTIQVSGQEMAAVKNGTPLPWPSSRPTHDPKGRELSCTGKNNALLLTPEGKPLALAEAGTNAEQASCWKVLRGLW